MSVLIHIGDTYVIHNSRNKKIYRTSNSQEKQKKKKKEKKLENLRHAEIIQTSTRLVSILYSKLCIVMYTKTNYKASFSKLIKFEPY